MRATGGGECGQQGLFRFRMQGFVPVLARQMPAAVEVATGRTSTPGRLAKRLRRHPNRSPAGDREPGLEPYCLMTTKAPNSGSLWATVKWVTLPTRGLMAVENIGMGTGEPS